MSKSWCIAVMLAVICLPVISEAHSTIDESMTCSLSTLEELMNMMEIVASNQEENAREIKNEIKDMMSLLETEGGKSNQTRLEDVAMQGIKDEIDYLSDEVKAVKKLLSSNAVECANEEELAKQPLVSALVGE